MGRRNIAFLRRSAIAKMQHSSSSSRRFESLNAPSLESVQSFSLSPNHGCQYLQKLNYCEVCLYQDSRLEYDPMT